MRRSMATILGWALLLLASPVPSPATSLDGGTETVHVTADNGAGFTAVSFTFKNETGVPIHDFIIKVVPRDGPPPLLITEVRESNTSGMTDFDVDDDGMNGLDGMESVTAGGMEMAGDADNMPMAPSGNVRIINAAGAPDILVNDTFGLDTTFSTPLVACDQIKVTPTNVNNLPILASVEPRQLDGARTVMLANAYLTQPAGAVTFVHGLDEPLTSLSVCGRNARLTGVKSPGARVLEDEVDGQRRMTLHFGVPVEPGETVAVEFFLEDFGEGETTFVHLIPNADLDGVDFDGDGVHDCADVCPGVADKAQLDLDADGLGDVCDPCPADPDNDLDGDGLCAGADNCPLDPNPDQLDSDGDGFGDACDRCGDAGSCLCQARQLSHDLGLVAMRPLRGWRSVDEVTAVQHALGALGRERARGGAVNPAELLRAQIVLRECLSLAADVALPEGDPFGGTQDGGSGTPAAGDDNRIDVEYDPTKSEVSSPCDSIYFIQTVQILVDGDPVNPGDLVTAWEYRDPATQDDSTHVDRIPAGTTPYYGGNGAGTGSSSPGNHGGGGSTSGTMTDVPFVHDDFFGPGGADDAQGNDFDASEIVFKFEVCAFCAAGEDVGQFFDCLTWEYRKTDADVAAGSDGTSAVTGGSSQPSQGFQDTVQAWDDVHEDFNLPPG